MRATSLLWSSRWVWRAAAAAAGLMLALVALGVVGAQAFPPEARSEQGNDIRDLYFLIFGVGMFTFVLVEAMILFVVLRYRRRPGDGLPKQTHGSVVAEITWTGVPLVIVVVLFAISLVVLNDVQSAPDEDEPVVVVDVVGRQWAWAFNYGVPAGASLTTALDERPDSTSLHVSNGTTFRQFMTVRLGVEHMRVGSIDGNTLTVTRAVDGTVLQSHEAGEQIDRLFNGTDTVTENRLEDAAITPVVTVPVGRTVRFNLASMDVIHAFYTPQFLTKLDAVPGRVHTLWVKVTDAGFYHGQCAEFCGAEHARMIFAVNALPQAEYDAWLLAKTPALLDGDAAAQGAPAPDDTAADDTATGAAADLARGQELYFANGCNICHGDTGAGGIGPTLAATSLTAAQQLQQYRSPLGVMPVFTADRVADQDVANINAWLKTLPLPATIVPGEGTP